MIFPFQITLYSSNVFMPKLHGLKKMFLEDEVNRAAAGVSQAAPVPEMNSATIFEVCLCTNGAMFAANIQLGCVDTARTSGICTF
jgi:hypothetical protein